MISTIPASRRVPLNSVNESPIAPNSGNAGGRPRSKWRRAGFALVNIWLFIHLTAIITAPATVGPSSQSSRTVWTAVAPYLQGLYLNHGFHYFAPQPGSSNLVSWTVTRKDGTVLTGRFPNFDIRPRLYYHRHFMLSEYLGNSPPELQAVVVKGFARNLCREYDGETVTISTVRHDLPSMERVRAGENWMTATCMKNSRWVHLSGRIFYENPLRFGESEPWSNENLSVGVVAAESHSSCCGCLESILVFTE